MKDEERAAIQRHFDGCVVRSTEDAEWKIRRWIGEDGERYDGVVESMREGGLTPEQILVALRAMEENGL